MTKHSKEDSAPHTIISERGMFLEQAHQRQQNSNVNTGMDVVITEDIRVKIGQRCPTCKRRVRGLNHVNGAHHRGMVFRHKGKK